MTDLRERLRKYGQHYEVCNEADVEIGRLRTAFLKYIQGGYCDETGVPCREESKCGCFLEMTDALKS